MKRTINLFKIHSYYLLSKKNIIVLMLSILFIQIINIVLWSNNDIVNINETEKITIVWQSIFTFEKIVIGLFSVFMVGNFCLPENENYKVLFIINDYNKTEFYLFKIITISFFLLAFTLLNLLFYLLIGLLINNQFIIKIEYVYVFLIIYLLSLVYGYLTIIFINIIPTFITIFFSFVIYLSSEFLIKNDLVSTFFPTFFNEIRFINNPEYLVKLLILIFFYLIFSIIIYRGKNY